MLHALPISSSLTWSLELYLQKSTSYETWFCEIKLINWSFRNDVMHTFMLQTNCEGDHVQWRILSRLILWRKIM
jgi:hypothetical protein